MSRKHTQSPIVRIREGKDGKGEYYLWKTSWSNIKFPCFQQCSMNNEYSSLLFLLAAAILNIWSFLKIDGTRTSIAVIRVVYSHFLCKSSSILGYISLHKLIWILFCNIIKLFVPWSFKRARMRASKSVSYCTYFITSRTVNVLAANEYSKLFLFLVIDLISSYLFGIW